MSNKFLGINSVNVLKKYIDEQIVIAEENTRVITLHAYAYHKNDIKPVAPIGEQGGFDPEGANIVYPNGWGSLHTVINNIVNDSVNSDEALETALSEGSIWMTVGVAEGSNGFDNWSTPIKISGQNGVSVRFKYAYDKDASEDGRNDYPKGVDSVNRKEYVWTKYGDDEWQGPFLWAVYASDASDVLYRYCVTATTDVPNTPASDVDPNWTISAAVSVTSDKPYMWMTSKRVPAGSNSSDALWSEPILFGHYGFDGKDGLDGNIPSYSITLYRKTSIDETAPDFVVADGDTIDVVFENNPEWKNVPDTIDDKSMLWYVVVNVNGGDKENPEIINTVASFSEVMRFSAIDGELKSYPKIKYRYYWSSNQTLPDNITEWSDIPAHNPDDVEGSLWMSTAEFIVNTVTNTEEQTKDWTDPIKLTGPRGPIAYDYRVDSQYGAGTADVAPTTWKNMKDVKVSDNYPYIWENRRLCVYKMKYANDGSIEQDGTSPIKVISQEIFRLSGLNGVTGEPGKNGNRLNTVDYTTKNNNTNIYNFDEINYFISNSSENTVYNLIGNKFGDFVSGYTGKFANIGTGNMIITAEESILTGIDIDNSSQMILYPSETVEIVTYNDNGECLFISLGKNSKSTPVTTTTTTTTVEEPVEPITTTTTTTTVEEPVEPVTTTTTTTTTTTVEEPVEPIDDSTSDLESVIDDYTQE